jgi:Bacterial SH3 domain
MFATYRFARLATLTVLTLAGFTIAAIAADQSATTSGYANLRQGPGTSFGVITTLDPGTDVTVHVCTGTWCAVTSDGDDEGFVAKSLLDFDSADNAPSPSDDAQICFYQGEDFSDANFCISPGDSDGHIPGSFNDAIESILITGDASVEVCTGTNMSGACATLDHSAKKLPFQLRDKISSYAADAGDNGSGNEVTLDDNSNDGGSIGFTLN